MGKIDILEVLREHHPRRLSRLELSEILGANPHNLSVPLRGLQMDHDIVHSMARDKHTKLWGLRHGPPK